MSGQDRWLSQYERAVAKSEEINAAVNERSRLVRNSQNSSKVTSQIRRLLNELSMSLGQLEDELNEAGRQYHITDKELLRRQDMVANLKSRREQLQQSFSKSMTGGEASSDFGRSALMGGAPANASRVREETSATRGLDSSDLMQQQQQIMRAQDQGLDLITQSIQRQKQIGLDIDNELTDQNEMLDELSEGMDVTGSRLKRETAHVVRVSEKAKTSCMFCTIVLLVLAIIIVAAVPI